MRGRGRRFCAGLAVAASLCACASSQRQTGLVSAKEGVEASTTEFRFSIVELARCVASEIEASADRIREASDDPTVQRDALRWKVNAIPEVQAAAVGPDPVIAGLDVWALVVQMRNFFAPGAPGAEAFGEQARFAQEAMARSEQRVNTTIAALSSYDGTRERPGIERWAAEHPLEDFDFRRESIGTEYAKALRGAREGGLAALDEAQASMQRIEYRLGLTTEYFPKQLRWNGELAAYEMSGKEHMDSVLGNLNLTLASTSHLAQQMPELLDAQRVAAFQSMDQQRIQTLDTVSRQGQAALNDAAKLLNEQRALAMKDVDQIVERRAQTIIDFALMRIAQIVGALLLVGVAAYALWRLIHSGAGKGAGRTERRGGPWSAGHHPGRRASDREHPAY